MTTKEIFDMLSSYFGNVNIEFHEATAGDSYISTAPADFLNICRYLRHEPKTDFDYLRLISAVDFGAHFSSIYHLYSYQHGHSVTLRVDLDKQNPSVPSVTDIWQSANWHERECYDMMGILYDGHPGLTRILLPHDWDGFPLRKDYKQPESYHGIKH